MFFLVNQYVKINQIERLQQQLCSEVATVHLALTDKLVKAAGGTGTENSRTGKNKLVFG